MNYDTSKKSLEKILLEITKKTEGKGNFFYPFDVFDPNWSSLINLVNATNERFNKKTRDRSQYKNIMDLIELKEYKKFHSSKLEDKNNYIKKFPNHLYTQIWLPFLEKEIRSLNDSFNEWASTSRIIFETYSTKEGWINSWKKSLEINSNKEYELEVKKEMSKIEKMNEKEFKSYQEKSKKTIANYLNDIFSLFGEVNGNSLFHALENKNYLSKGSNITGFILLNKDSSLDIFHADIGITFLENIKKNAKNKVVGLSDKEILNWATKTGNTSKDKNEYPLSGGGITHLKELCIVEGTNIFFVSGSYVVEFQVDKEHSKNLINIDYYDPDELIKTIITKKKFYFPGTIWMMRIEKPKDFEMIMEKINMDKLKEETKKILKEYII